jgi:hypothetical protein
MPILSSESEQNIEVPWSGGGRGSRMGSGFSPQQVGKMALLDRWTGLLLPCVWLALMRAGLCLCSPDAAPVG